MRAEAVYQVFPHNRWRETMAFVWLSTRLRRDYFGRHLDAHSAFGEQDDGRLLLSVASKSSSLNRVCTMHFDNESAGPP